MSIFKKNWKEDKVDDGFRQVIPQTNDCPPKWKDREFLIYGDGIKTGDITKWHNPEGQLTHYTHRRYNKKGKKLITPSGKPASFNISENTIALNGAISLGFNTIVQPAANAGATLHEI